MDLTPVNLGPSFVCVLRSGGEYRREHVEWLRRQFEFYQPPDQGFAFRCLTDTPEKPYDVPMETDWPGWWALLEAFRFTGPTVLVGLDTLITGPIRAVCEHALHAPDNVLFGVGCKWPRRWTSSVMVWRGDWLMIPALFHPVETPTRFRGDQNFTADLVRNRLPKMGLDVELGWLEDEPCGSTIASYKPDMHGRPAGRDGLPDGAGIVFFAGQPRPWEVGRDWVPDHLARFK